MSMAYRAEVESLYVQESGNLRRRLERTLGRRDVAEDVVQDAYLRMLTSANDGTAVRCKKAFLFTVASNLAIDSLRREQRIQRLVPIANVPDSASDALAEDITHAPPGVEDTVDAKQRLTAVLEALAELPTKCQTAFVLHKFQELSYAEVASHLGVTVSMVEKYLSRGLQHLRQRPELFEH